MSYAVSITQEGTVLSTAGKYVEQDIVVGMSDSIKKAAATYTPSTTDQVIPAGKYLSGAQTIKAVSGTKNITANGTYDVTQFASAAVNVPLHMKRFSFSSPSAVANQNVLLVSGDADVAAHYADDGAYCIVRKLGTITGNGIVLAVNSNRQTPAITGAYSNYNGTANNTANVAYKMSNAELAATVGVIQAMSNGNIYIRCANLQNNFGGADYEIIFIW